MLLGNGLMERYKSNLFQRRRTNEGINRPLSFYESLLPAQMNDAGASFKRINETLNVVVQTTMN